MESLALDFALNLGSHLCLGDIRIQVPALSKPSIHAVIAEALASPEAEHGPLGDVPFLLSHPSLGDLAFYAFTLTAPPGGRPTGEYKVQIILPGQPRGARGSLGFRPGTFTLLIGWSVDESIFVLWDAYAHPSFAYSQNLQVKGAAVWLARIRGMTSIDRRLRHEGLETLLICTPSLFESAIRARIKLSASRLAEKQDGQWLPV